MDCKKTPRKWTDQEDMCLRSVVEKMGPRNWKEIAKQVPDRTHVQCLQRWNKVLRPGLKKGTWQVEEDEKLAAEVNGFLDAGGEVNWTSISKTIEGRTAKQCRERWRCNLDPGINKNEWTPEEDLMIMNLQRELGNRWALLAKSLPGRTENSIKTRFRSLQRSTKRKWSHHEDSMLMTMIRGNSSFEDVAQAMNRRSLNSIRVRYKQLSEGSQIPAVSPPRPSTSSSSSNMFLQQNLLLDAELTYPTMNQVGSIPMLGVELCTLKRGLSDVEDEHSPKALKLDIC